MRIPVEHSVLGCYVTAAHTEILIPIPWKNCRLVGTTYSQDIVSGGTGTATLELELDAPSGSVMNTVTLSCGQAAGSLVDGVMATTTSYAKNLDRGTAARDHINIEVTVGSQTGFAGMLYMYFEPMI